MPDILVCDCRNNTVSWIRQYPAGTYTEKVLASDLIAPAHIQVMDFDNDGDPDLMVAVLGLLFPSNDKIGSVVVLENDGSYNFTKHVIQLKAKQLFRLILPMAIFIIAVAVIMIFFFTD